MQQTAQPRQNCLPPAPSLLASPPPGAHPSPLLRRLWATAAPPSTPLVTTRTPCWSSALTTPARRRVSVGSFPLVCCLAPAHWLTSACWLSPGGPARWPCPALPSSGLPACLPGRCPVLPPPAHSAPPLPCPAHLPCAGAVRPMDPATDATASLPVITHGQILESDSASPDGAAPSAPADAATQAPAQGASDNGCTDVAPSGSTCEKQKVRRGGGGMLRWHVPACWWGVVCAARRPLASLPAEGSHLAAFPPLTPLLLSRPTATAASPGCCPATTAAPPAAAARWPAQAPRLLPRRHPPRQPSPRPLPPQAATPPLPRPRLPAAPTCSPPASPTPAPSSRRGASATSSGSKTTPTAPPPAGAAPAAAASR